MSIPLPNSESIVEIAGIQHVVTSTFAKELYQVVDTRIGEKAPGFDWFKLVNSDRLKNKLPPYEHPKDARFLLAEVVYHKSPVRMVLPEIDETGLQLVYTIRSILNKWSHDQVDPTASNFLNLLYPLGDLCAQIGLEMSDDVEKLIERAKAIKNNVWIADEGAKAQPLPKDAQEYAERIEKIVEKVKQRPPVGSPWVGDKSNRKVQLNRALLDITEKGVSIKHEFGDKADEKIREFLRYYPLGSDLHIDTDGAVLGYKKGEPYLVGWMGEEPDVDPDEIRGFLLPHEYEFVATDVVDIVTQERLSDVAEEPIDALLNALTVWGLPLNAVFNVSIYGDVVFTTASDTERKITKVHKGIWFPGQLPG
jgi:hypothetical protein